MTRLVPATLPLLLATGGCTVLLDPGEAQCQTATDCAARGFMSAACTNNVCVDGVWGCLGKVVEPTPDPTKTVTITVSPTYRSETAPA